MHWLKVEEVARTFCVTTNTVRRWWKDARSEKPKLVHPPRRLTTKNRLIEELSCLLRLSLPVSMGTRTIAGHLYRLSLTVSRSLVSTKACKGQPTAKFATQLMHAASRAIGCAPKHSISDQGVQFKCRKFKKWLKRHGVKHRNGAVGRHGSISILERAWRTLKEAIPWTWCIFGTATSLERHVETVRQWYNTERPHTTLRGAAPDDISRGRRRRARDVPPTGKWKLTIRWTGATRDLPIIRLRKVG